MGRGLRHFCSSGLLIGVSVLTAGVCAGATAGIGDALNGKWQWEATCERGSFNGVMQFVVESGTTFSGRFMETNFWDKGTMSNGIIAGNHISFDRSYGLIVQHLSADLSGTLHEMSGPYDSTMFGKCTLRGKKL
jgi:hypothetical protein